MRHVSTPTTYTSTPVISVTTGSGTWDGFSDRIAAFLYADLFDQTLDGRRVRGFRTPDTPALWVRDYSDMLRATRFIEADVTSVVDAFAATQASNGRVFDYVTTVPEKVPCERENWEKWVRVPVEADVEYRFVKAAYLAWQATGDAAWVAARLPSLDAAMSYTASHPWRWDAEHGLVKRPYTIDTWDFDYTAGRSEWLNFAVTDKTYWGIFHGDNSGFYESARLLAQLYRESGQDGAGDRWDAAAEGVRERANSLLFNGTFYRHFHKLTPVEIPGVDEEAQLSLSTPMAVNRGLSGHERAATILNEYRRRAAASDAFAEWFSIDPPFPDGIFGDEKLKGGAYINGGIFPLVGGELALAALDHGFEAYGVETLDRYRRMIEKAGETYLWYFPDGTPSSIETSTSPDAQPTDGWGSSAMLHGFLEGLCGVRDERHSFRRVFLAPRWPAAGEERAKVRVEYEASNAGMEYEYLHDVDSTSIRIDLRVAESDVRLHVLLPAGSRATACTAGGEDVAFRNSSVEESAYVDAEVRIAGRERIEITYGR